MIAAAVSSGIDLQCIKENYDSKNESSLGEIDLQSLVENYSQTDTIIPSFKIIEDFIENYPRSQQVDERLESAINVASAVVQRWEVLNEQENGLIRTLAASLIRGKTQSIFDRDPAKRLYQNLLMLYLKSEVIDTVIAKLSIFVTTARRKFPATQDLLINACTIAKLAILYFSTFNSTVKNELKTLQEEILGCKHHYKEDEQGIYSFIKSTFQDFVPDPTPVPASVQIKSIPNPSRKSSDALPHTSKPPAQKKLIKSEESNLFTQFANAVENKFASAVSNKKSVPGVSEGAKSFPESFIAEEIKKLEEENYRRKTEAINLDRETLTHIFHQCWNVLGPHFMPFVLGTPNDTTKMLMEKVETVFSISLPHLFFHPPNVPTNKSKWITYDMMAGIYKFVLWFKLQKGIFVYSSKGPSLEFQTQELIKVVKPMHGAIRLQLIRTFEGIFKLLKPPLDPIKDKTLSYGIDLVTPIAALFATELLEEHITPELIGFIYERFKDKLDKLIPEKKSDGIKEEKKLEEPKGDGKPNLESYKYCVDEQFSEIFGELSVKLINTVLDMVKTGVVLNAAKNLGVFDKLINSKKKEIGMMIQLVMGKIMGSESTVTPLEVIFNILLKEEKGEYSQALREFLSLSAQDKAKYSNSAKRFITIQLFNFMIDKSQSHFLLNWMNLTEEACKSICGILWQITQSQEIQLEIVLNILKSVLEGMEGVKNGIHVRAV